MKYRREVDGLRAVAVVSVILGHGGFTFVPGGFVGVDIFFVISGFLITTIILSDLQKNKFSILEFYERRARRILPALAVVMLACLPAAFLIMTPSHLADFGNSFAATSLFASNIYFWRSTDYFAMAAEFQPLLHTWSLAIEEQFYVGFPLLMLLLFRFGRRLLLTCVCVFLILSLVLAEWGSRNYASANYYLLPTRMWELLAGSICAFLLEKSAMDRVGSKARSALTTVGAVLIVLSVAWIDENTPFPSVYALMPVMGAVLIILFCNPTQAVGAVLSHPFMVGAGLLSYSAYLWHQPMFAFARLSSFGDPAQWVMLMLSVSIWPLAYLTWRFVEQPFRVRGGHQALLSSRTLLLNLSVVLLLAFSFIGAWISISNGFPSRLSVAEQELLAWRDYDRRLAFRADQCFLTNDAPEAFDESCDRASDEIVLWGDSHAGALYRGVEHSAVALGETVTQWTSSACPPIRGIKISNRPHCDEINDFVFEKVADRQPRLLAIHSNWSGHFHNPARIAQFRQTLVALKDVAPETRIVLLGSIPQWSPSLPEQMLRQSAPLIVGQRLATDLTRVHEADDVLEGLASDLGLDFISVVDGVCEGEFCTSVVPGVDGLASPLLFDDDHLTWSGAVHVSEAVLRASFDRILRQVN